MRPRTPLKFRFWSKVERAGPEKCWLWKGSRLKAGYGQIGSGGKYGRPFLAHRVSWEIHFGPIPEGLCVLHHCDNPPCVNPYHLFLGTHADNAHDREIKGRGNCAFGESAGAAKLTANEVIQIRETYAKGDILKKDLAKQYPVCAGQIGNIIRGKKWKHLFED